MLVKTQERSESVAIGDIVEVISYRRLWKEGVPPSIRKKPNHCPAKTKAWTKGFQQILLSGVVVELDDCHCKLKMVKNRFGKRPLGGVYTSLNWSNVVELRVRETVPATVR